MEPSGGKTAFWPTGKADRSGEPSVRKRRGSPGKNDPFSADELETAALLSVNDARENPFLGRELGTDGFKADIFLRAR
ncbi:hypothetical protein [Larkinella terrae]|uniref:Uncharacterized protein n=1 Tax=Larkinella terrae TaxID=2025311 RepID=A0A7K0EJP9_9BACT|nr:hypothetical protein [Larkinella terrae]MRS61696.1 hypothetical protein [Larkinella terrae]